MPTEQAEIPYKSGLALQNQGRSAGFTPSQANAAKAMPAIIQDWYKDGLPCGDDDNAYGIAIVAYLVADAMMKARTE